MRPASLLIALLLAAMIVPALAAMIIPALAAADGDPASDVLLGENVFYPTVRPCLRRCSAL